MTSTALYLLKCRYNLGKAQMAECMAQGRLMEAAEFRRRLPQLLAEISKREELAGRRSAQKTKGSNLQG